MQVVTFNAPGMFRAAVNSLLGLTVLWRLRGHGSLKSYYAEFDRALHLRSEYDLVSLAVGPQISGNTRTLKNTLCARLKPRHWWLPPRAIGRYLRRANCAHRMATMVKLVSGIDRYRQPVRWV
ncbi:MAG: hypothetical protein EA349_07695 [Halomonadaceae bacterium]|nr:MAG: hypothetical protein EA349_07695 [Halomonadaceae bacterium]